MSDLSNKFNKNYSEEELIYQEAYNQAFEAAMAYYTGMALSGLISDLLPVCDDNHTAGYLGLTVANGEPHRKLK